MMNNSLKEIGNQLLKSNTILLYPHVFMDGDTLGSSVALCQVLRKAGKTVFILIEDPVPAYLAFLDQGCCTYDLNVVNQPDVSVAVDCSDIERFVKRRDKFLEGKVSICLDHHLTNHCFADYNYIDNTAAATGEIIYDLIHEMKLKPDVEEAEAIYTALTTDTGNFQYTNTTKRSHLIAADLFDIGIDLEKISVELYQNVRLEKLKITNEVLNTIEMMQNGQAVIAYANQEMLSRTGASMDETEGIIEMLRNISGVEIAAFLKENGPNEIKVSFRSKTYGHVAEIAESFGGGGHRKAAGCTIRTDITSAKEQLKAVIAKQLKETDHQGRKNQNEI